MGAAVIAYGNGDRNTPGRPWSPGVSINVVGRDSAFRLKVSPRSTQFRKVRRTVGVDEGRRRSPSYSPSLEPERDYRARVRRSADRWVVAEERSETVLRRH